MRVSGFVHDSIVDGPGLRFVVFTQGCLIGCVGCHNPETWDPDGGTLVELDDIVSMWRKNPLIEGVTFSGGDPLLQADKTLYLAKKRKKLIYQSFYTLVNTMKIYWHLIILILMKS